MVYCGEKSIVGVMSQRCTCVFYSSCLNDCRPSRGEAIISKNCSVRWTWQAGAASILATGVKWIVPHQYIRFWMVTEVHQAHYIVRPVVADWNTPTAQIRVNLTTGVPIWTNGNLTCNRLTNMHDSFPT